MDKDIKALIRTVDDIGFLVYDPHSVDLGRLTITVARAYPSGTLVPFKGEDYEATKLVVYRWEKEYSLYRRKEEKQKGGNT